MSGTLEPAGSINDVRTQAHLALGARLADLPLTNLLVYVIATVPDTVLPFLAWQFDLTSPLWSLLASTASSQRQLITNSISLHKYVGTPYALKKSLGSLGWQSVTLQEGQGAWGGTTWPLDQGWAVFRVRIAKILVVSGPQPPDWDSITGIDSLAGIDQELVALSITSVPVTSTQQAVAINAINFFKPQRSLLDSLIFVELPVAEPSLTITDDYSLRVGPLQKEPKMVVTDYPAVISWLMADTIAPIALHDAKFYFSGGITYTTGTQPALVTGPISVNGNLVRAS